LTVFSYANRAIIENASGKNKLVASLRHGFGNLLLRPHRIVCSTPFVLVFGVYFSTYVAANTIDTVCDVTKRDNQAPKFLGATVANMASCIYKDRQFTRMFGLVAPKGLPLGSYGMFAARDSLTISASFNMPKALAQEFQDRRIILDRGVAMNVSQMILPAIVQLVSTPMHLIGLDLYNRPGVTPFNRLRWLAGEFTKTTITRIVRIAPAFGVGGVGNRMVKERLNELSSPTTAIVGGFPAMR
jgi:hypothetical protein